MGPIHFSGRRMGLPDSVEFNTPYGNLYAHLLLLQTRNDARFWVEYCNLDEGTYYSDLRVKYGRDKPFIVAINPNSTEEETVFKIQNGAVMKTFTPFTTSEFKNCEQGDAFDVTGDIFTFTIEPSSITTFVSN